MKVLYRPQRGGLAESMQEVKEFNSLKECIEYVVEELKELIVLDINDITISHYTYDARIDWETYIVCLKAYDKRYNMCLMPLGFLTFKEN